MNTDIVVRDTKPIDRARTVDVTIVLDRSGSMAAVTDDTIGGFNTFLREQQEEDGRTTLTLVQFNDEYDFVRRAPIEQFAPLTDADYRPRGMTALLDAVGRTINETGERLAAMPEPERPDTVLFVIITDGRENASREFSRPQVFDMITHQREKYSWEFVFLGANQDAFAEAGKIGIPQTATANYAGTSRGTRAAFATTSETVSRARSTGQTYVSDDDRSRLNDQ